MSSFDREEIVRTILAGLDNKGPVDWGHGYRELLFEMGSDEYFTLLSDMAKAGLVELNYESSPMTVAITEAGSALCQEPNSPT